MNKIMEPRDEYELNSLSYMQANITQTLKRLWLCLLNTLGSGICELKIRFGSEHNKQSHAENGYKLPSCKYSHEKIPTVRLGKLWLKNSRAITTQSQISSQ